MGIIIINLLLLSSAVYGFFYVAKPGWARINELKLEAASYKETIESMEKIQELRDKLLNDYNSISEEDKDKLKKMFPSSINHGEFMIMMDNISSLNSMTMLNIVFEQAAEQSGKALGAKSSSGEFSKFGFSLELKGSYNGFKNFLANFERNLLIMDAELIDFSSAPGTEKAKTGNPVDDIFNFRLKANAFLKSE